MSWRFQREAEKSNYFWNIYKYVRAIGVLKKETKLYNIFL